MDKLMIFSISRISRPNKYSNMHIRHVSGMTLGLGSGSSLPCQAAYLTKYCRALALRSPPFASQVLNVIFTVYELGCEKMVSYLFHLRYGAKFNVQRGERCLALPARVPVK